MPAPIPLHGPPRVLTPSDPDWPARLDDLSDAPRQVSVAGTLPPLQGAVAIVGTRASDPWAEDFTRALARSLAGDGSTIVSGGALGIDTAAHEGALAVDGATVAVLPTGFDHCYPPGHGPLFAAIAAHGALLTEVPEGAATRRHAFVHRNRLIAALASVVVVVQAPLKSGALSTAAAARRLGRPVLAVPGPPWDPRSGGCLQLLRQGALVCTSTADVLSVRPSCAVPAGAGAGAKVKNSSDVGSLSEYGRSVLQALSSQPCHPDELSVVLGMPAARLQQALLELQLAGLAEDVAGSYRRTGS